MFILIKYPDAATPSIGWRIVNADFVYNVWIKDSQLDSSHTKWSLELNLADAVDALSKVTVLEAITGLNDPAPASLIDQLRAIFGALEAGESFEVPL